MRLNYIHFLICLVFISQSCLWHSGDKDLGNGYFLFVDGIYTCIIRSSTESYKGTGPMVIPETVIKLNYNEDVIVALSKDIDTKEKRFWIIYKNKAVDMKLLKESEISWDSVKWSNVNGPLDSVNFYKTIKNENINLELKAI